jgi:hypothetical protein
VRLSDDTRSVEDVVRGGLVEIHRFTPGPALRQASARPV